MPKCIRCRTNYQAPGADGLCGPCWAKDTTPTMTWPSYSQTTMAMLATGKCCRVCSRQLYALPGDDRSATICRDCAGI